MKYINHFKKAVEWIKEYSINASAITISSVEQRPYPEVTGYYIPSLLQWNETDCAQAYADWLLSVQNPDGSWMGSHTAPYAFDSGQILKGLVAMYNRKPSEVMARAIIKGCDWITGHIDDRGSMATVPDIPQWAGAVPDGILLYALEPIRKAAQIFNREDWHERAEKAVGHFLGRKDLTLFSECTLSHFHAYICEALCDLGYHDRAADAMRQIEKLQRSDGSVPAYPHVRWICSTGLIQYSIIWYKLGIRDRADLALDFAVGLQNPSGGWYGSYPSSQLLYRIFGGKNTPKYFPKVEISWAVKFFLDAVYFAQPAKQNSYLVNS